MIETLLIMAYFGGAIGCWLAIWHHPAANLQDLRRNHVVIAIVLTYVIAGFWPIVLTACLVRGALDD